MSPFSRIEALDDDDNGVRVGFEWRDDRYHHAIYGVHRDEPILLAESIEGDAIKPWPPSPPLQQLHKQQNESGEILFLTGMAGNSHWSGSVSTTIGESGPEVTFDFACRHRTVPEWLGVTYQLARSVEAEMVADAVILKDGKGQALRISADYVSVSDGAVTIAARPKIQEPAANTSRWVYAVRLTD